MQQCDVCQEYWAEHRCGKCLKRLYCSQQCQRLDWLHDHATQCIGNYFSGTDRTTGVAVRRATQNRAGVSRVVKLTVDVVTDKNEQPAPGRFNIEWKQIRKPPGADPNGRYWRASVTQKRVRIRLSNTGPVVALTQDNSVDIVDEVQPEDKSTIITPRVPKRGEYRYYFIREVRLTFDTDKPAILMGNTPSADERFQLHKEDEAAQDFRLWSNRKETLEEGFIGRTDPTIFDAAASRTPVRQRALRTATRRPSGQPSSDQPLASQLIDERIDSVE